MIDFKFTISGMQQESIFSDSSNVNLTSEQIYLAKFGLRKFLIFI